MEELHDNKSSKKRNRNDIIEETNRTDNFELLFPKHAECILATSIFELGLIHSSPKLIMPLMPYIANLSTEHVKSHLQKYRIHRQRSKDEFIEYFDTHIKKSFNEWESSKGWNDTIDINTSTSSLNNSNNSKTNSNSEVEIKEITFQSDTASANNKINNSTSPQLLSIGLNMMKDSENILKDWQILCKDMIICSDKLKCDLEKCNDLLNVNNNK